MYAGLTMISNHRIDLEHVGIEPRSDLAQRRLIHGAAAVRVQVPQIGRVAGDRIEGAAENSEVDLIHDPVAVGVAEQAIQVQLAGAAAHRVGRADVIAVRSAAVQRQTVGRPVTDALRMVNV